MSTGFPTARALAIRAGERAAAIWRQPLEPMRWPPLTLVTEHESDHHPHEVTP
jgi:hypothetical protein